MTGSRSLLILAVGLAVAVSVLVPVNQAAQGKAENLDVRQTVERFFADALAGKAKEAAALAEPGQISEKKIREELTEGLKVKKVSITSIYVSEKGKRALAITEQVQLAQPQPDGVDKGYLAVTLTQKDNRWLVRDVDFESQESAKEEVQRFLKKFSDAKEMPRKAGK
jgi:hypothetical protein